MAYGKIPCAREVFADILEYPYMCAVDNSFSKYGAHHIGVFSGKFAWPDILYQRLAK